MTTEQSVKHGTGIEWTHVPGSKGETWNPVVGCSLASPGCTNCYAMDTAGFRLDRVGGPAHYQGTTKEVNGKHVWTGKVALAEHKLKEPLQWSKPRTIFVNSMGDLFHERVPSAWIDAVFAIMAMCPQHRFIILTKRSARMRFYMNDTLPGALRDAADNREFSTTGKRLHLDSWPALPNVWLGVSVEDQKRAEERIPDLLNTPAAVRFISAEPLLGLVDLSAIDSGPDVTTLDWVVVGGESGDGARPMHPDWARTLRDQCARANVPFFFKQWGEYHPAIDHSPEQCPQETPEALHVDGKREYRPAERFRVIAGHEAGWVGMCKLGKKNAGRTLDGREHTEFPQGITSEVREAS